MAIALRIRWLDQRIEARFLQTAVGLEQRFHEKLFGRFFVKRFGKSGVESGSGVLIPRTSWFLDWCHRKLEDSAEDWVRVGDAGGRSVCESFLA
ncbi:hypothetical protein [Litorimonas sp.]|uniref:hypothetical protein n=1 Tax=Litorimonas sp. TaxID=1892381 RepID=UPI003A8495A5